MKKNNAIDELFPGLSAHLEGNQKSSNWVNRGSNLFNIDSQEYLYQLGETSDFEHEKSVIDQWFQNIECHQSCNMGYAKVIIANQSEKFSKSGFSSLDEVNLQSIHDTAEDYQTQWSALQLKNFISSQNITLKESVENYTDGLLTVYGLCDLSLVAYIASRIQPRIILIFEPDIDLISKKISNDDCEKALAKLEHLNCNIFLNTDSNPEASYLRTKRIIESINMFSQERIFSINFRHNDLFAEINSKYKSEDSLMKDLSLLGFFVDEIHMIMNASITFTQKPPKIIKYESYKPHDVHAVITASGPSLEKNLPLIAQHRDKYHLLCCYSTLGALVKNNISPDYHCNQERHCLHLPILDDPDVARIAKETTLICSANNDPRMNSIYQDAMAIFRSGSCASALFARNTGEMVFGEGNQVANLALISAILLGYRTIHLFGIDLGAAHKNDGRSSNALIYDRTQPRVFTKKRPGNLGNEVWVDDGLIDSAIYMSNQLTGLTLPDQGLIDGLTVYNYGEGQKIQGAIPSNPEDFPKNIASSNNSRGLELVTDSVIRYDVQTARARFIAFDWRNRLQDYLIFVRKCIQDPFDPRSQEQFFERSERQFNVLNHQVMSRLMSGTLSRSWFLIIKTNSFMPELDQQQQQQWKNECVQILEKCLESMARITLEMLDHIESLEDLSSHNFESLGYHPKL